MQILNKSIWFSALRCREPLPRQTQGCDRLSDSEVTLDGDQTCGSRPSPTYMVSSGRPQSQRQKLRTSFYSWVSVSLPAPFKVLRRSTLPTLFSGVTPDHRWSGLSSLSKHMERQNLVPRVTLEKAVFSAGFFSSREV